jgi:hypothetical protein
MLTCAPVAFVAEYWMVKVTLLLGVDRLLLCQMLIDIGPISGAETVALFELPKQAIPAWLSETLSVCVPTDAPVWLPLAETPTPSSVVDVALVVVQESVAPLALKLLITGVATTVTVAAPEVAHCPAELQACTE